MRKLGVEVDCAADISEARVWWRADVYNLVLIDIENELGCRDKFCEDLRSAIPPQQLAFLVGKPEYLANSPDTNGAFTGPSSVDEALVGDVKVALSADVSGILPQRWGILEASRRISVVRSLSHARSQAIRERPAPPRDSEIRPAKRATETRTLDDLLRKEMQ
ncbi:MAG: hypothetical protein WB562_15440 [Candidatus Sulfotelmatobacter sp.]